MKHRDRAPEQDDLLRPLLVDMINIRHELVKLAGLIDWDWFDGEWAGFFPAPSGRPATRPRLVAGLMYLQHTYGLSDEAVVARWVENPYFQHFTGETFFQHQPPIHPSSLSRWRVRIGEEGAEWLLTKTIKAGRAAGRRQHNEQGPRGAQVHGNVQADGRAVQRLCRQRLARLSLSRRGRWASRVQQSAIEHAALIWTRPANTIRARGTYGRI